MSYKISPKQRTGITHILEFISSAVSETFCLTLCFLLFVKPVIVPHSEQAQQNSVTETRYQ